MKDNEFAEYVNRITSIARTYAHHQSLRERIAHELDSIVKDAVKEPFECFQQAMNLADAYRNLMMEEMANHADTLNKVNDQGKGRE